MKNLILAFSLLCLTGHSQIILRGATLNGATTPSVAPSGGGGCTPSYANTGGAGNRTSSGNNSVSVTAGGIGIAMQGGGGATDSKWVDGGFANGQGFFGGGTISGPTTDWIQFDFGSAVLITELTYYQQDATTQGTWKVQGSNNGSTFIDIGGTFTLGGVATETISTPSSNVTSYRYYRVSGVSGTTSSGPWVYEMEFKICGL